MHDTNGEMKEIENLLELFRPYMEQDAQPYYDVVYSRKFGYLFLQFYPEGDGNNEIVPLETAQDLLLQLFSWIALDVRMLDLEGEHMTKELFPAEADEIRNRIYPLLEKCGEQSAEYKKMLDKFLWDYPDIFLEDAPF